MLTMSHSPKRRSSDSVLHSEAIAAIEAAEALEIAAAEAAAETVDIQEVPEAADISFPSHTTVCYKERSRTGLGKLLSKNMWPHRRLVFWPTQRVLAYYDHCSEHATNQEPRGVVNLEQQQVDIEIHHAKERRAPTPHELHIIIAGSFVEENESAEANEDSELSFQNQRWKFCFDTKEEQMQWVALLHDAIVAQAAHNPSTSLPTDFEHSFAAGDHVFRWEMIIFPPVIYPIQIHAICLEAGRNCVILADFGLTGYGKQSGADFKHNDTTKKGATDQLQAAWKKFRPKEDQRLNIVTLIDPKEIRKWTKANYGRTFGSKSKGHFHAPDMKKLTQSLFGGGKTAVPKLPVSNGYMSHDDDDDDIVASVEASASDELKSKDSKCESVEDLEEDKGLYPYALLSEGEENEWFTPAGEKVNTNRDADAEQPSIELKKKKEKPPRKRKPPPPLPKSDPKVIVLARANFLLEFGEAILPPYHAFYSNSECIAVWCKTGRWSTLQTAVFLTTTSVGGAKSATLTTLGVVAAHAVLAPVVAVGGLLWVSAPMIILKKSRGKWNEATAKMTGLFWEWAPPEVYCAAIENWSGLVDDDDE